MPPRKHRPHRFDIECLERRDCPAAVTISDDQTLSEAGRPVVLTVSLAAPDRKPVVVGYSISGDAAAGRDYRLTVAGRSLAVPGGALTFRPGETRKVITVTPVNDLLREPTERFTMNFSPLRNAQLTNSSATVTLLDDDSYTASIIGPALVVSGTPAEFTVRLSAPATKTEVIHVSTQAGSASDITDFRPLTRLPLVFNPGDTSRSFRVPVQANTPGETDETFFITAKAQDPKFPDIMRRIVTIDGDGEAPPPTVSVAPTSVIEGNTASTGITIDWVTIGDVGNAADDTGFGAVNYEYRIGKYEITVGQYVEFLNAVAKSDPYGLYNENMGTNLTVAGIARLGAPGSYVYQVMSNGGSFRNRPVTYVSSFDCARFANWMHNGQGAGNTENGVYTLVAGQTTGVLPQRNAGAKFFLPTEDEWYKAAYYKGGGTNAGYWEYATRSDTAPDNSVGASANQANYFTTDYAVTQSAVFSTSQNYLTNVGAFSGSPSAYGTFDQSGNVQELTTQSRLSPDLSGRRGGDWYSPAAFDISSAHSPTIPTWDDGFAIGFRLASTVATGPNVPPPTTVGTTAWFTVSLSAPSAEAVTVRYDTADGTATEADGDYEPVINGILTFEPGETAKSVGVKVLGDTKVEADETFTLILSAPVNATLGTATAVGTILNDDLDQPSFQITVEYVTTFYGEVPASVRTATQQAVNRWQQVIVGDLPDFFEASTGKLVDDFRMRVQMGLLGIGTDGTDNTLANAGPLQYRPDGNKLPWLGETGIDPADVTNPQLVALLIHEIGHALGFAGSNPNFQRWVSGFDWTGPNALREYRTLAGTSVASVPLESKGDPGTARVHWSDTVFGTELMTGFVEPAGVAMPLSRITVGAFADLGYTVNYAAADAYTLTPAARAAGANGSTNQPNGITAFGSQRPGFARVPSSVATTFGKLTQRAIDLAAMAGFAASNQPQFVDSPRATGVQQGRSRAFAALAGRQR
jgi:sulfatase modifying factor 1